MHMYQKHILDLLRTAPSLRYAQMQPREVESSHFKYHLNQLIKDGLVMQVSRGEYALTNEGKSAVDRLSSDRVNPRLVPKLISYTLLYDDTAYYLYRKAKEPYLGLLNFVGGKVHVGESSQEASLREVSEKTGVFIPSVERRGVAEIRVTQSKKLLTHAVAYLFTARMSEEVDEQKLEKVLKKEIRLRNDLAPDTLQILDALERTSGAIFLDLDIDFS